MNGFMHNMHAKRMRTIPSSARVLASSWDIAGLLIAWLMDVNSVHGVAAMAHGGVCSSTSFIAQQRPLACEVPVVDISSWRGGVEHFQPLACTPAVAFRRTSEILAILRPVPQLQGEALQRAKYSGLSCLESLAGPRPALAAAVCVDVFAT